MRRYDAVLSAEVRCYVDVFVPIRQLSGTKATWPGAQFHAEMGGS